MALLDADCSYQAILTHDPRFDGVFHVDVTTTCIYCRNVCRAKMSQRKNCTFPPSAAAAEQAGFRPCLLRRPELSPGNARIDATGRLAAAVAKRMAEGSFIEQRFGDLAQEFGVSDRHLRRVVQQAFSISPIELAQTHKPLQNIHDLLHRLRKSRSNAAVGLRWAIADRTLHDVRKTPTNRSKRLGGR